jgi:hypothetical protein
VTIEEAGGGRHCADEAARVDCEAAPAAAEHGADAKAKTTPGYRSALCRFKGNLAMVKFLEAGAP